MDFSQLQQPALMGTKKRRHMPNELYGRFSAKSDFIRYFKENCKSPFSRSTCVIQCNFTYLLNICSIKIFSKKSSPITSNCFDSIKSSEYACLFTMNWLWSRSGQCWSKTRSSWDSFPQRWRRIEFQIENTSSTFSTLSTETISKRWSSMHKINATSQRRWPDKRKPSKSVTTGGTSWTVFLLCHVSTNLNINIENRTFSKISMMFVCNRAQRQNSPLTQILLQACPSTEKTTKDFPLWNVWSVQSIDRRK